jgi:hypothetical protein
MKKIIKYINNNIVEFRAIVDTLILTIMIWLSWFVIQCLILYLA